MSKKSKSSKGVSSSQATGNRGIMFRCFKCRKGFTRQEWSSVKFCSNCGRHFPKGNQQANRQSAVKQQPVRQHVKRRKAQPKVYAAQVVRSPQRNNSSQIMGYQFNGQRVVETVKKHPFMSSAAGGVAGAGMLLAGPAIVSLGAALTTGGLVVAGLNVATIGVTAINKDTQALAHTQCKGIGLGLAAAMAGGALVLVGKAVTIAGAATLATSGAVASYGVVKEVQAARERRQLVAASGGKVKLIS